MRRNQLWAVLFLQETKEGVVLLKREPQDLGGSGPLKGGEGSQGQEGAQGPRQSSRENRGVPPFCFIDVLEVVAEAADGGAPATYEEALSGPEAFGWKRAFEGEMRSLKVNGVYTLVDRP